jgi:hypothetical protein
MVIISSDENYLTNWSKTIILLIAPLLTISFHFEGGLFIFAVRKLWRGKARRLKHAIPSY